MWMKIRYAHNNDSQLRLIALPMPYRYPGSSRRPSACYADVIATRPYLLMAVSPDHWQSCEQCRNTWKAPHDGTTLRLSIALPPWTIVILTVILMIVSLISLILLSIRADYYYDSSYSYGLFPNSIFYYSYNDYKYYTYDYYRRSNHQYFFLILLSVFSYAKKNKVHSHNTDTTSGAQRKSQWTTNQHRDINTHTTPNRNIIFAASVWTARGGSPNMENIM